MANARTRLRHFKEWTEEADIENLNELTGRDLADFVAWRRDDIKAITLQKQLSTVRQALRYWADIEGVTEGLAEKLHAPELPDGAEDLPHILDAEGRTLDREPVVDAALARFREAAVRAAQREDEARAADLVDVSYDLEAWGARDLSGLRDRLDAVGEGTNY